MAISSSSTIRMGDHGAAGGGVLRVLLIDNYDSYTYNVYQMLSEVELATGERVEVDVIANDAAEGWQELAPRVVGRYHAIVLSPGPGTPSCDADVGICRAVLERCTDVPILGVCLGHQLLAHAHGAAVVKAPVPFHGRLSKVVVARPPAGRDAGEVGDKYELLKGIPNESVGDDFRVVRYHSLVVDEASLPDCILPLAWTEEQAEAGETTAAGRLLMALAHKVHPHYGVQFHPESICTSYGRDIFKNFLGVARRYHLRSGAAADCSSGSLARGEAPPAGNASKGAGGVGSTGAVHQTSEGSGVANGAANLLHGSERPPRLAVNVSVLRCEAEAGVDAEQIFLNCCCERKGAGAASTSVALDSENTFWLDSSNLSYSGARFSFMGKRGGGLWRRIEYSLGDGGATLHVEDNQGRAEEAAYPDKSGNGNATFWDCMDEMVSATVSRVEGGRPRFVDISRCDNIPAGFTVCGERRERLPFDFGGGFVGYIGYEMKEQCGGSRKFASSYPDACFFFADQMIAVDHTENTVYLIELCDRELNCMSDWMAGVFSSLGKAVDKAALLKAEDALRMSAECMGDMTWSRSRDEYVADIGRCKSFLVDGDSYEICLTNRLKVQRGIEDPLAYYHSLRRSNPAPYSAFMNFGGFGGSSGTVAGANRFSICCSSPERFLKLTRDGVLEAKPIKGTIGRGASPEEDERARRQLQGSDKDRAENLMIVDLLRNDLGRVSDVSSVHVPKLMDIESYATVHQMVSTIRGLKADPFSPVDCIRCAFPAGSMTGAPKIRTMQIIDSLETEARGVYSGTIGFISAIDGAFDLNVVIRTVVMLAQETIVGAGGAITIQSDAQSEFEEIEIKSESVRLKCA